ncbi:hypothetical protein B0H19DRAFT_1382724 [Mycena capillaripes]|nr:hypothetical protein B0H19DRAFT_1382724 [Mycena capillaripes]
MISSPVSTSLIPPKPIPSSPQASQNYNCLKRQVVDTYSASSLKSSNFSNVDLGARFELGLDAILLLKPQAHMSSKLLESSSPFTIKQFPIRSPAAPVVKCQILRISPGVEAGVVHGLLSHLCSRQSSGF